MLAPLQLRDYRVATLSYEHQSAEPRPEEDNVDIGVALGFEMEFAWDEEQKAHCLTLLTSFNEEGVPEDQKPYVAHRGHIEVQGWFRWIDNEVATQDNSERLLLVNGLSMLYGIARTRVADVTSTGPGKRLLLPSISFLPIVSDWIEEEETAS
jgi:preprotein translocase subunit SecB